MASNNFNRATSSSNIILGGQSFSALDGEGKPVSNTPVGLPSQTSPVLDSSTAIFAGESKMVGNQLWNFKVVFNNSIQKFQLAPNAIKALVIEDSVMSWPLKGYLIVDNRMEGFERSSQGNDAFYHIRADARDELQIDVWPSSLDQQFPDSVWKITMDSIIYDVEDLPSDKATSKLKRFYFWDKKFQFLLEKTSEWSTATGLRRSWFKSNTTPPIPIAHATDEQRSMYTGDAIASLLIDAGYESFIDIKNWDSGASKICYTAKADCSVYENITYLLENHISSANRDFCGLLQWDRTTNLLNLVPFNKSFERAGKTEPGSLQFEHLFYEEYQSNSDSKISSSPWKAPYNKKPSMTNDIKATEYNTIHSYKFSQTAGFDNAKAFVTRPVYSHWHKKKQFQVDVKENEIQSVKTFFNANYVSKLLGTYPVMTLNQTKKQQRSISPIFSPISVLDPKEDRYGRSSHGKCATLFSGVMLNQCMIIRLRGSTHRHAGTFVGIDRLQQDSDTHYDYQICGQYLVVQVKHFIEESGYENELVLVKVHAYDKLLDDESIS